MERIEVSVVIPARDAARTLDRQLEALASQRTDRPFEVVVADNGSTDDTRVRALAWEGWFARLRVVDASARPGASAARNIGIGAASSDRIVLCDADDIVGADYVAGIAAGLETWGIVSGVMLTEAFAHTDAPSEALLRDVESRADDQEHALMTTTGFHDLAMTGLMGVRRAVHDEIGGFREDLLDGGEDLAYPALAQIAGHPLGLAPRAYVHVRPRRSLRENFRQQRQWSRAGLPVLWEYREHGTREFSLASSLRGVASSLGRLPRTVLADHAERVDWARGLGNHLGEVEGNVRYRGPAILTGLGRRAAAAGRRIPGFGRRQSGSRPNS